MTDLTAPYLAARDRLHALIDGVDDDTFNARPAPEAWSAAECVVHLNKIAKGYLPVLEAASARDVPRAQGPFRYGWVSRKFIDMMKPGGSRVKTMGAMKPPAFEGDRSDIDRDRVVARFDADIDRYLAAIDASDGLDLARIKVSSPFLWLFRLPLGAFLEAMGHHCVRHVDQAERAVAARTV